MVYTFSSMCSHSVTKITQNQSVFYHEEPLDNLQILVRLSSYKSFGWYILTLVKNRIKTECASCQSCKQGISLQAGRLTIPSLSAPDRKGNGGSAATRFWLFSASITRGVNTHISYSKNKTCTIKKSIITVSIFVARRWLGLWSGRWRWK